MSNPVQLASAPLATTMMAVPSQASSPLSNTEEFLALISNFLAVAAGRSPVRDTSGAVESRTIFSGYQAKSSAGIKNDTEDEGDDDLGREDLTVAAAQVVPQSPLGMMLSPMSISGDSPVLPECAAGEMELKLEVREVPFVTESSTHSVTSSGTTDESASVATVFPVGIASDDGDHQLLIPAQPMEEAEKVSASGIDRTARTVLRTTVAHSEELPNTSSLSVDTSLPDRFISADREEATSSAANVSTTSSTLGSDLRTGRSDQAVAMPAPGPNVSEMDAAVHRFVSSSAEDVRHKTQDEDGSTQNEAPSDLGVGSPKLHDGSQSIIAFAPERRSTAASDSTPIKQSHNSELVTEVKETASSSPVLPKTTVKVQVESHELGKVEIRAALHNSEVGATLRIERDEVQRAIAHELPQLEKQLNERDISMSSLTLLGSGSSGANAQQQQEQGNSQQQSHTVRFSDCEEPVTSVTMHEESQRTMSNSNGLDVIV